MKRILPILALVALVKLSGCVESEIEDLINDLNTINFSSNYTFPTPAGTFLDAPHFSIDSVAYAGDTAKVYSRLTIPAMKDSSAVLYDVSFNYWDEQLLTPVNHNQTEVLNDSIYFDHSAIHFFNTTVSGLTVNTSYRICAVSARYIVASDTITISGWCTSFWTIE